ncbi:unnamed protein product [Schistocephalus solidus]|uniref:Uncharacterized protein n=1 Tax=Schistocephalus solidus TaxID=70667 RepID=A0A183SBG5_SCHSO|nr:unnamed protein product [Schistocephalus solidus]
MRETLRTSEFLHDFSQPVAIHLVKGFRQIHEGSVEVSPNYLALLLQLASGEDHVDCLLVLSEATLAFREQSLLQASVQTIEENAGDVQQRDSLVVVAELAVPPLLVEVDNGCVFEILRKLPLVPLSVHDPTFTEGILFIEAFPYFPFSPDL